MGSLLQEILGKAFPREAYSLSLAKTLQWEDAIPQLLQRQFWDSRVQGEERWGRTQHTDPALPVWSWWLGPSRVFTWDCPTEPIFSLQTQQIQEEGPCSEREEGAPCRFCACQIKGGKSHQLCFQARKKLKIDIVLLLYLDQPEQTNFAHDHNQCD